MAVGYTDEQEAEPIKIAAFLLSAALKSPADMTKRTSPPLSILRRPFIYRITTHPDVPWFFSHLTSLPMKYTLSRAIYRRFRSCQNTREPLV